MRPQFYDFIELFKKKITVDHISSKLECWECDSESREVALQFMNTKNYDLLGIRKNGKIIKKVLTNKGKIKKIDPNEIIPEDLPITKLLDKFMDNQEKSTKYFLNLDNDIEKIVTIADLQKGPARLLFFGLIMNFEVVCIDFIIKSCDSNWQKVLKPKIFKKIRKRYDSLKDEDLDIDMLHCSFIDDKVEIIKKIEKFKDLCLVCEKGESDIRYLLKKLKQLRNNLAHSNHIRARFSDWDLLLETINFCKIFTREMREFL